MGKRTCTIEECDRKHYAKDWCRKHYLRFWKYGDPLALHNFADPDEAIKAKSERRGDCAVWLGALDRGGYGRVWVGDREVAVHRYAWERANGPIPEDAFVDHICHNRACIEPRHLRLATRHQNAQNRSGPTRLNRSGFRGVTRDRQMWRASVTAYGTSHVMTGFGTAEEAAEWAERKRRTLFGEFAGLG